MIIAEQILQSLSVSPAKAKNCEASNVKIPREILHTGRMSAICDLIIPGTIDSSLERRSKSEKARRSVQEDIPILENIEKISTALRAKRADVMYRIKTEEFEAFVFVLLEHQSRKDYLMPFRMLEYTVAIWRHFLCYLFSTFIH